MVQKTSLVILTRNEIEGVKAIIRKIPFEAVDEFFAVDYKSTDGTVEFFEKHEIPVIKQKNPGRGEAFKLATKKSKGEFLVFFSPDGNENPADIPKLIGLLKAGNDLAIASRFMKNARNEEDTKILKFRAWANQMFTMAVKLLWGGNVTDTINGYRAIRKSLFKRLNLDAEGFAIEFQMTIRSLKAKAKIAEIPTIEEDRIGGQSTSHAIPTGFKFIYYLLRELVLGTKPIKKEGLFSRSVRK